MTTTTGDGSGYSPGRVISPTREQPSCGACYGVLGRILEWYNSVIVKWIEQAFRTCASWRCYWWCLCCNKWTCWLFLIIILVVSMIIMAIVSAVLAVLCGVFGLYCLICSLVCQMITAKEPNLTQCKNKNCQVLIVKKKIPDPQIPKEISSTSHTDDPSREITTVAQLERLTAWPQAFVFSGPIPSLSIAGMPPIEMDRLTSVLKRNLGDCGCAAGKAGMFIATVLLVVARSSGLVFGSVAAMTIAYLVVGALLGKAVGVLLSRHRLKAATARVRAMTAA
jgi:hypothetical protein